MADYLTKDQLRNLFEERVAKLDSLGLLSGREGRWLTVWDIKGLQKRFSTYEPDLRVLACPCSEDACIIAINLDTVDSKFMKDWGNCKASSTYIKVPVAFSAMYARDWQFERRPSHLYADEAKKMVFLRTREDVEAWFDKLETEIPYWVAQSEQCAKALKFIKTEGKQYKDIMKPLTKRSPEWKAAREAYENLILVQMKKITKRDEIMKESRKGLA